MIIHSYSQWEEPETPPFTVEDLVKAVSELMMRLHMTFNEALQALLERGLPLNAFLQVNGLDKLIEDLIRQLEERKKQYQSYYNMAQMLKGEEERSGARLDQIRKKLAKLRNPDLLKKLEDALRKRKPQDLMKLKWDLARSSLRKEVGDALDELSQDLERLLPLQEFLESYPFAGPHPLSFPEALRLKRKFEAIDELIRQLQDALRYGDLLSLSEEMVRRELGEKAYQELMEKRRELMRLLDEALVQSGLVERQAIDGDPSGGLYKLTPGAARKIGERYLTELNADLVSEGIGRHQARYQGEGGAEQVATRPFEPGDSLSHLDLPESLMNAVVRQASTHGFKGLPIRLSLQDLVVHETKGTARTSMVLLLDMSGSMSRYARFYNAKKVVLTLEALIRSQFPEDKLHLVGFATFAKRISMGEVPYLAPKPVTHFGSPLHLRVDLSRNLNRPQASDVPHLPQYFTNIQRGLELARVILGGEESKNKSVILISDGAPTAYYDGPYLHLTYPPTREAFQTTLREVSRCASEGIAIHLFLLADEYEFGYLGEESFVRKMIKVGKGKLFYPQPNTLTQFVLVDYLNEKKKLIQL